MREWLNRTVSKTVEPVRVPRVRIPLSPANGGDLPNQSERRFDVRDSKRSPRRPAGGLGGRMPPTGGEGGSKEQTRCLRRRPNPSLSGYRYLREPEFFVVSILERCPSGRRCTLGKRMCPKGTEGSNPSLSVYPAVRSHANTHRLTPPGPEGSNGKRLGVAPWISWSRGFLSPPPDTKKNHFRLYCIHGIRSYRDASQTQNLQRPGWSGIRRFHAKKRDRIGAHSPCIPFFRSPGLR